MASGRHKYFITVNFSLQNLVHLSPLAIASHRVESSERIQLKSHFIFLWFQFLHSFSNCNELCEFIVSSSRGSWSTKIFIYKFLYRLFTRWRNIYLTCKKVMSLTMLWSPRILRQKARPGKKKEQPENALVRPGMIYLHCQRYQMWLNWNYLFNRLPLACRRIERKKEKNHRKTQ